MGNNFKNLLEKEMKKIDNEGKIENIEIEEIQEREINKPKQIRTKAAMIKKGLLVGGVALALSVAPASSTINCNNIGEVITVNAKTKKDKTKPKFKIRGTNSIKVEKGKEIKLGKVTAKDNKDGNVTKKIKVKVTKGSTNYSSIAKAIKNNKKVKFNTEGKYKITYTVSDKAGNKATKTRFVTVTSPATNYTIKPDTTTEKTTQSKSTTSAVATTEKPATTQKASTTQSSTTTQKTPTTQTQSTTQKNPTTEVVVTTQKPATTQAQPTTEAPAQDPSIEETFYYDGNKYVMRHLNTIQSTIMNFCLDDRDIAPTIEIENEYKKIIMDFDYKRNKLLKNSEYVKFLGKITAIDYNGKDVSDNVMIFDYKLRSALENDTYTDNTDYPIYIFAFDENAIGSYYTFYVRNEEIAPDDVRTFICKDPLVIGYMTLESKFKQYNTKTLKLEKKEN